ncbi:DUF1648 domain-containing protein [Bacillus sp. 1P06AnD]|uniref:DUF1648 domain-containing protein n=1 Tax=Bacillus sp. 1P06AnD TaxID=3132208 RepID=UPI00399F544B
MEHLLIIFIMLPAIILIAGTPYFTRKTELFGVSMPEEISNRSDIQAMRKRYALQTGITILGLTAILLGAAYLFEGSTDAILAIGMAAIIIILPFLFYLPAHKKLTKMKRKEGWFDNKKTERIIIDTTFHSKKIIHSYSWFLIPGFITITTALISMFMYDSLPSSIPTHFDFRGNPDSYSRTTFGTVFLLPTIQFASVLLMMAVNMSIKKAKQQINAQNPAESAIQSIAFRRRWSGFIIVTATFMCILFLLVQLSMFNLISSQISIYASFGLTFLLLLYTVYLTIKVGQGGSRIKTGKKAATSFSNRDEDEHWKLGLFYWNREDPSIFVEKRFGIGWTCNFAHPIAWISILAILLIAFLPLIFM